MVDSAKAERRFLDDGMDLERPTRLAGLYRKRKTGGLVATCLIDILVLEKRRME